MSQTNGWKTTVISILTSFLVAVIGTAIFVGGGKADEKDLQEVKGRTKTVEEFVVEQKVLNERVSLQNRAIAKQLDELPERIAEAVNNP